MDVVVAVLAGALLLIPGALIALLVRLTARGPALYWSERVGRHNQTFRMQKVRTMSIAPRSQRTC